MTDWNLLAKYLDEQCSPAEIDAVHRWSTADPAHAAELALLRRAWRRAGELPPAPRIEALWERIAQSAGIAPAAEVVATGEVTPTVPRAPHAPRIAAGRRSSAFGGTRSRWLSGWTTALLATAAAVTVMITGQQIVWHRAAARTVAAADTTMREYRTARGQRATIVLLDGTRVVLGVDSRLRVSLPASGERGQRIAQLDGEALFEVAHDAASPFVVHAGGAIARDIGTTFGVRAYQGEPVRVVVVDGSVSVGDSTPGAPRETVLGAHDLARIAPGNLEIERGIDPRPYVAWSEGRLVFRQAPLLDVVAQLDRAYDVHIALGDSALRDARVSATFDDRDGVDVVLRALAATLDATVQRRGQDVTIRARR